MEYELGADRDSSAKCEQMNESQASAYVNQPSDEAPDGGISQGRKLSRTKRDTGKYYYTNGSTSKHPRAKCNGKWECTAVRKCKCPTKKPSPFCNTVCTNKRYVVNAADELKKCVRTLHKRLSVCKTKAYEYFLSKMRGKEQLARIGGLGGHYGDTSTQPNQTSDPKSQKRSLKLEGGSDSSGNDFSTLLIVGLVVAIFLALIAAGITAYCCLFKKSDTEENSNNKQQAAGGYQQDTSKAPKSSKKTSIGGGGAGGGGKSMMKSACIKSSKTAKAKSSKSKKSSLKKSGKTISSALKGGQKLKKDKASNKSNKTGIKE